jgi:hypothetical protein
MKRIRKVALGAVLTGAGMILGFLDDFSSISSVLAQAASAPPQTSTWSENVYCAKGDVWIGPGSDGHAQLPQACVYTGMDGTPSPGKVTLLAPGENVVAAVSAAHCGDTIQLQKGRCNLPRSDISIEGL